MRIRDALRTLHPGYFALVMATSIVSIAMRFDRAPTLSVGLLWLAGTAYLVLFVANVARMILFRKEFGHDLAHPRRGFAMFTFVAATDVLGVRLASDTHYLVALDLLAVGWLAWLVLGYVLPWAVRLRHAHRPVLDDANGTWFIWVVATQSVAVLAATLAPEVGMARAQLALLAMFCWSVGVFLYGTVGILVAARILLYPLRPSDLTPPYWVAMGATAITALAGTRIVAIADEPTVTMARGSIVAASVAFWAFGSWLIPPLVAASLWKHGVHRIPLRYEPTLWSVVFPIGMYGVAGHYLGHTAGLPIVEKIGDITSWVALAAWAVTFVAMLHHVTASLYSDRQAMTSPVSQND